MIARSPWVSATKSHARAVPGAPKLVREVPGERARGGRAPAAAETRRPSLQATRESGGRSRNFRAGVRAAAPVTPAARPGLRPALSRSLRGPLALPAARPGPRLRPHSAASPEPRAAGLRGLTGPRRGAAALLSPPLPRSPGRWARGAGVRSNGPAAGRRARGGGAERSGRPGARSGARDFFPEGRGAARRTLVPRRGPRVTDRGGPEPPAGGAALRGPRRVQTARVGCGSAVLGVAEPGRWEAFRDRGLGRRPRSAAGSLGSPEARGRRRTASRGRRAVPPGDADSPTASDSPRERELLSSAAPNTYRVSV
ncbi:translation initiation factor IF-2-like [Onychomys torridus]|uniref:translation initiation factor IF-2-like n=1 Tax=Onychomys torridus TaxID=38674 RepID=UPI00167FAE09|nr:translation initiation factor IF-2-like [Onychomys torridus]